MIAMEEQIRELDEEDGERGKRGTVAQLWVVGPMNNFHDN